MVWHVRHKILQNKQYALKLLRNDILPEEGDNSEGTRKEILDKFEREAQIGAIINHPGIVVVRDFDCYEGIYYIVMDYIEGKDLRKLCDGQPLSEDKIIYYTLQILSALDAAHKAGIIHRDIKPANILIDKNDRAFLTDFGIAKALDTLTLGKSSMIMTPDYAAPEQIDSKKFGKVCPATDLYSLGITMYHMAIGKPPFTGTTLEVIRKQTEEIPSPPQRINTALSFTLSLFIMKAMEKTIASRFSSAREFFQALQELVKKPTQVPFPTKPDALEITPSVQVTIKEPPLEYAETTVPNSTKPSRKGFPKFAIFMIGLGVILVTIAIIWILNSIPPPSASPSQTTTPTTPHPTSNAAPAAAGQAPPPPPVVVATAPATPPPAGDTIDLTVESAEGVKGGVGADGSYLPSDTANVPKWYQAIAQGIDILLSAKTMVAWDNNYVGIGLNVAAYQLNQFAYPNMAGKSADIVKTAIDDLGKIQTDLAMERDLDPTAPKAAEYRTRIEKVRNALRNLIAPAPTKKKKKLGFTVGELYKQKVKEGGDMYKKKVVEGIRQAKGKK